MPTIRSLIEGLADQELSLETYGRSGECVRRISGGELLAAVRAYRPLLREAAPEDRRLVGLLFKSEETIEFLIATFASLAEGYTVVPLYPNWSAETQLEYLQRYGVRTLAVGDGFESRAARWRRQVARTVHVTLDPNRSPRLSEQSGGRGVLSNDVPPAHPCAWIFTSGTSSEFSRCTEISTANLEAAIHNMEQLEFLRPGMTVHSPLSASHIFAFVAILGFLAIKPRRVIFSDVQHLARLSQDRTGKVDALILVPIVLNRLRGGFYDKLASPLDPRTAPPELRGMARIPLGVRRVLKRLVRRAEDDMIALEAGSWRGKLALPRILLARWIFGKSIRRRLGSPDFVVVGGAKPNLNSMALLEVMGIPCLQGWGMTETTGPLAVCSLRDRFRGAFGTCGGLFPQTSARIENGELIVEGPQVARGYVEPDGTLVPFRGEKRTGDSAEFDSIGRLRVLGKVSDRITTDNGLNYSPLAMEEALKAADLNSENVLEEAVVIGDGRPRLGCVFFLREGKERSKAVDSYLAWLVRLHNSARPVDEHIGPWTVSEHCLKDSGCLGPSGKLVRRRVEEKFAGIYGEVLV
jgi:long-chain acyl-CoA synthetase